MSAKLVTNQRHKSLPSGRINLFFQSLGSIQGPQIFCHCPLLVAGSISQRRDWNSSWIKGGGLCTRPIRWGSGERRSRTCPNTSEPNSALRDGGLNYSCARWQRNLAFYWGLSRHFVQYTFCTAAKEERYLHISCLHLQLMRLQGQD